MYKQLHKELLKRKVKEKLLQMSMKKVRERLRKYKKMNLEAKENDYRAGMKQKIKNWLKIEL